MNKVLIVEDDQIVANICRNKLAVDGFHVEVAYDGHAGLEMVRGFRPDVVLLDLMLPKMTGVELMKQIRSDPDFQHLPIVVFSNTYLTNMVQEAWKAGATKCLSKINCTPKHIIDALRGALGLNKAPAPPVQDPPAPAPPNTVPAAKAPPDKPATQQKSNAGDSDAEFLADLRKSFVESLPATLATLRALLQVLTKAENEKARVKQIHELYRRIHALTGNAGITGMLQIAQMADALEALLKELHDKPKNINASTLRTVTSAIDFLGILFTHSKTSDKELPPASVLVVDDEAISCRAITYALEKARLKSINVEDPLVALKLLSENKYDLVFLDVDMPNMNGFELCSKLRTLPTHKKTPVVFVTSLNDFESRTHSMMSGGNEFIAKPFLFIELAVKALVHALRGRLEPGQR
jgi:CheY-like chemotaxis protein